MSSTAFRRSIEKLVLNRFSTSEWTPTTQLGNAVMKCFDPNVCSCLDWGQPTSKRKSDAQKAATSDPFEWKLCPNPVRPWRLRPNFDSVAFTGKGEFRREPQDRCAGFSHDFHLNGLAGPWDLEFKKCPEDDKFLVVTQTVRSCVRSPHDFSWTYFARSKCHKLTQDEEMRGISWCSQRHCSFSHSQYITQMFRQTVPHHR